MRPLVRDEKRRTEKYGEKYQFPKIFEKYKIRIKWEDTAINIQHKVNPIFMTEYRQP